jgi:hypothetical protein
MSIKKDCNNCGKKFDAKRANSLYCSDSCKTQAYQKRAAKKVAELEPKEKLTFYLDEFKELRDISYNWACDGDNNNYHDLDLPMFCFLRSKYPKKANPSTKQLTDFFEAFIDGRGWTGFSRPRNTDAYKDFEKQYYNDEFEILESKEAKTEVSEV